MGLARPGKTTHPDLHTNHGGPDFYARIPIFLRNFHTSAAAGPNDDAAKLHRSLRLFFWLHSISNTASSARVTGRLFHLAHKKNVCDPALQHSAPRAMLRQRAKRPELHRAFAAMPE
jgi:hypothetical protein